MSNDGRAAEDHGIAVNNGSLEPGTDTRFPLMVDNSALDPAMMDFPEEPAGRWTEITLSYIIYACNQGIQRLYNMLPKASSASELDALEAARSEFIHQLKSYTEALLVVCYPVIPRQRATILMARTVIGKLELITRQQWLIIRLGMEDVTGTPVDNKRKREAFATDEFLVHACKIMELNHQTLLDDLLRNYRWIAVVYPQMHVLLYILWHLCVRPTGPSIERAWKAVDRSFALEEQRRITNESESKAMSPKWAVLAHLREKALRVRESLNLVIEERSAAETNPNGGLEPQMQAPDDGQPLDLNGVLPDDILWEQGFSIWDVVADDLNVGNQEYGGPGSSSIA